MSGYPDTNGVWREEAWCQTCDGRGRVLLPIEDHGGCGACQFGIGGPHPHDLPGGRILNVVKMVTHERPKCICGDDLTEDGKCPRTEWADEIMHERWRAYMDPPEPEHCPCGCGCFQ